MNRLIISRYLEMSIIKIPLQHKSSINIIINTHFILLLSSNNHLGITDEIDGEDQCLYLNTIDMFYS